MSVQPWNHNIHYHNLLLRSVPRECQRSLDVGCGQGLLARELARHCEEVIAIDLDHEALARATASSSAGAGLTFVQGDVMTYPFSSDSFDLITVVSTLHHLPLEPALVRFRRLLKPGGVLAVVGLYRAQVLGERVLAALAFPTSWVLRSVHGGYADVGAPVQNPTETLGEIRTACAGLLPGAAIRRLLLFRYFLVWRKP